MIKFKWQRKNTIKFIRYLGVLNIFFTILLSCLGNSNKVYASVYKTGTSDHYSIQVSQLASGREEIIISWHNIYEGSYTTYVDLVNLKIKGANGTTYQLYLCLHDTDEITVSFTGTDVSTLTVETIQSWEFTDYDTNNLTSVTTYLNQVMLQTSNIETSVNSISVYVNSILSNMTNIQNHMERISNKITIEQYLAFKYISTVFPGALGSTYYTNTLYPEIRPWVPYGRDIDYNIKSALAISPGQKTILIVASPYYPLASFSTTYVSPSYSSSDVEWHYKYKRVTSEFYITGYYYENKTSDYAYFQHNLDTTFSSNFVMYPLYYGDFDTCPYLDLIDLSPSQVSDMENNADYINDLSDTSESIETQFNTDFNNNLDNIDDTEVNSFLVNNKLINSASWVRARFNTIVTGNPFGDIIQFSLFFGLALLLIGRIL